MTDLPVYEQLPIRDAAQAVKELVDAVLAKGLVVTIFNVPIKIEIPKA